jgi:hypothetical protein
MGDGFLLRPLGVGIVAAARVSRRIGLRFGLDND